MDVGVALPQFDYTTPGAGPVPWAATASLATRAESAGFGSVWLSDHLFMEVTKYGGPPGRHPGSDPFVGLGALVAATSSVRLGTLVTCAPLRPALVAGRMFASLDRLSGGRIVAGVGAGWLEAEFDVAGVPFCRPGERLAHLAETIDGWRRLWSGAPGAPPCRPGPVQPGGPPIWVGGRGDRLLGLAAGLADGWNVVWRSELAGYVERLEVLERACEVAGRDPDTVVRSVGLTTLVGEDEADVGRRFDALAAVAPPGVVTSFEEWRVGRLAGTVEQVAEQVDAWRTLGVASLILSFGALPFSEAAQDALDVAAAATVGAS